MFTFGVVEIKTHQKPLDVDDVQFSRYQINMYEFGAGIFVFTKDLLITQKYVSPRFVVRENPTSTNYVNS